MKPSQSRRYDFALASYWPRAIGLGLGFLVLLPVLVEYNPWWALIGPSFQGLIWPHLAFRWRHPSGDSERAEWRNQLADHFMAGAWLPLIGFNVLPSALMVAFLGMNSMIAGGPRHFLRGMLAHAAGTVVGLLVFGVRWHPETTMVQVLSCLPLLLHPIWVSYMASRASSKLRRQRQDLTYMSQHDALSGLYNRGYWEEAVRTEFAKFQRSGDVATLVLADLDHFKRVNDQLGHGAGDEVLRGFAERLRTNLRAVDTPGRYGGEEFGILLPSTSPGDAGEIMQRLQASLHSQPLLPQRTVTASFGVAALTPRPAEP